MAILLEVLQLGRNAGLVAYLAAPRRRDTSTSHNKGPALRTPPSTPRELPLVDRMLTFRRRYGA